MVKLGFKPVRKSKRGVKMNVKNKNQEVNPTIRVSNKRGIQSQDLESQRESNQKWSIMTAANKK